MYVEDCAQHGTEIKYFKESIPQGLSVVLRELFGIIV